jgi:hypothetical protein
LPTAAEFADDLPPVTLSIFPFRSSHQILSLC